MKNKVTQRRLLKDIDHISLADFLSRYIVKTVDDDDNVIYIIKIVRDLSVQREGVWDLPKKMNFINSIFFNFFCYVIILYAKNSLIRS